MNNLHLKLKSKNCELKIQYTKYYSDNLITTYLNFIFVKLII